MDLKPLLKWLRWEKAKDNEWTSERSSFYCLFAEVKIWKPSDTFNLSPYRAAAKWMSRVNLKYFPSSSSKWCGAHMPSRFRHLTLIATTHVYVHCTCTHLFMLPILVFYPDWKLSLNRSRGSEYSMPSQTETFMNVYICLLCDRGW